MNAQKRKRFLFISNIVVSVLAAASIVCCFVLPIWKAEFSVSFNEDVGDALKSIVSAEDKNGALIRSVSAGKTVKTGVADVLPDVFSGSGKEIYYSFVDSLCKSGLQMSFSQSFSAADMICAVYDPDPRRAEGVIDGTVDGFIHDAEKIINDFMQTAAKIAAEEMVKSTVDDMLKSNYDGENYDGFMEELGTDKERIEALIERVIDSIMTEDATVGSVTEIVLESADEAQEILSKIPKYSEQAETYDDEDRENVKKSTEELLSRFADENGKINFKETLIQTLLNAANQAIEQLQNGAEGFSVSGTSATADTEKKSADESAQELKSNIKKAVFNFGGGVAANLIVSVMAVAGALLAVLLFMLFYTILRTLTNIGKDDPGFCMFLPIFGGISSYLLLVIIPSLLPRTLELAGRYGGLISIPDWVTSVLRAFTLRFSSGTAAAFFFALALFVFGFFYEHQRRALRKDLHAAQEK